MNKIKSSTRVLEFEFPGKKIVRFSITCGNVDTLSIWSKDAREVHKSLEKIKGNPGDFEELYKSISGLAKKIVPENAWLKIERLSNRDFFVAVQVFGEVARVINEAVTDAQKDIGTM